MEGLTFNTKIGYDDIKQQFNYLIDKQKQTIRLLCNGHYGIVSDSDPSKEGSSVFPTLDGSTLSFTSGRIVTKEGDFVEIPSFYVNVPPINEDTLVLYSYELIGSVEKRISNSGKAYSTWFENKKVEDSISFLPISKYAVLRDNVVCIAVIKYSSTNYIDITKANYAINRPWFSLCDIEHRNQKGTGSDSVPHSIGLNDLTSSDLTIYDQLLNRGIIVSKDLSLAGIPGHAYKYEGITDIKEVGGNAAYIELKDGTFPNAIMSVRRKDTNEDIICHYIKGTRLIALDQRCGYLKNDLENNLEIQMCITSTLLCNVNGNKVNEISFESQAEGDTIITQGLQIELADTNVSFADCSNNFNKTFEIVVNKDGTIHKEPEILGYTIAVTDINNYDFAQEFEIPVKLQIAKVESGWEGVLSVDIVGILDDGTEKSETITMSSYDNTYLLSDFSTNYYKKITSIKCYNNYAAKIIIFGYSNRAIDRRLKVARVDWNNGSISNVLDIRPISTVIQDPYKTNVVKEAAISVINSLRAKGKDVDEILIEDFNEPEFLDLNNVLWVTSNTGINYPIIPDYLPTSDNYLSCYRSRLVYMDTETVGTIYAYLVGASDETLNSGSVRLVTYNSDRNDIVMEPVGNGLFKAKTSISDYQKIKVVVSGKASGISVFKVKEG
jgi:hypothetical protein